MAMTLQSNSNYKIISQDESQSDKVVFHVKLTDSCLKSLECHKHQTIKNSKSSQNLKPTIRFNSTGKTGLLFIPSKSGSGKDGTTFNFSRASLFNDASTAGMDCFQQKKGDLELTLLGNITEKLTVSATNDSYETTRNKMAEAENKRKGNSAKVIELSTSDNTKKNRKSTQRPKNPFRKLTIHNKFSQSSSSVSKGLREKVIHLLALRPLNKLELRLRLERDGVKLKDASILTNILQQVSAMQDNQYNLHRHLYNEIQVDTWSAYTDEDREAIKTKLISEMGQSAAERLSPGLLVSSTSSNNSSKRPHSGGANPAGKKQRIAHTTLNSTKNDLKQSSEKSPPKITSRPTVNEATVHAKPRKELSKLNQKLEKQPTDKNGPVKVKNSKHNANNDDNNNNCSLTESDLSTTEDYLLKYPKITSYSQRCSYKDEFMRGYNEYNILKERSDLVSNEFIKLREKLKDLTKDSEAAQAIRTEIFKLYDEKKEEYAKDRKKIDILYPKLSHIKQLVMKYDQAHVLAANNQEDG